MYNKVMKITILAENNSRIDNYLLSEPAFSLFIEHGSKKILFDTGYSDVFLKNAIKLGVNLETVTDIVLSHGHNDHTRGLCFLKLNNKNIKFTAHPNIFDEKIGEDKIHYGCPISKEELEKNYNLNLVRNVYNLSDDLLFLGEIENNKTIDIDDSALVYAAQKGLFIITGCSHSGIINIVNYAKKATGINKIWGILGGFHLVNKKDDEIEVISKFFEDEKIEFLAPCHCCNLNSKIILSKRNKIKDICTGDVLDV